jgi:uncharacterized protein YndB with AHSA1/START domain
MNKPDAASQSIVIEKELPYPPAKIWRALTEGALLKEWLLDNDFEPVVGRRCNFRAKPMPKWNGIMDCEVLSAEPNQRLSYTWNVGEGAADGLKTVVAWTLTPTQTGTLLRMEHSGFRPDQQANYKGAQYGWQLFLGRLETTLASLP